MHGRGRWLDGRDIRGQLGMKHSRDEENCESQNQTIPMFCFEWVYHEVQGPCGTFYFLVLNGTSLLRSLECFSHCVYNHL